MKTRRKLGCTFVVFLCFAVLTSGCDQHWEQFTRKFIRQKKTKRDPARFLQEPVRRSNVEYYREHYLYWKSWHSTLVRSLGGNRKREVQALREARRHLAALPKYLEDEYAETLSSHVARFDELTEFLYQKPLPAMKNTILARQLDRLQLRVERQFAFSKISDHLLKDPSKIDLAPYREDVLGEEIFPEKEEEEEDSTPATQETEEPEVVPPAAEG